MSLTELIQKVKNQDAQAFEELYNQFYQSGFSLALQFTKNEEDALDIMQDVFITVYSKLDTLEDGEKFKSWYMQIVANKCRDFLKKQKPTSFTDANAYDEDGALQFEIQETNRDFIPDEAADYTETVRIVDEMMGELPEEQRLCLLLYFANDMTIPEIAKSLQVSEATVKSRLKYGKDKLRGKVDDYEKKNGIRLRSIAGFAFIPFLRWVLQQKAPAAPKDPAGAFARISQAITKTASTATKSGGLLAGLSSLTTTQKVISGVAAGAIVLCAAAGVGTTLAAKGKNVATPPQTTTAPVVEQTQAPKTQITWSDYILVEISGVNGRGSASVEVNFAGLDALLGQEKLQAWGAASSQEVLSFTLSQTEGLSNGDTITLTVASAQVGRTLEDVAEHFSLAFLPTMELTVEKLSEFEIIDVLAMAMDHLTYRGGDGDAYASFQFPSNCRYDYGDRVRFIFRDTTILVQLDGKTIGELGLLLIAENAHIGGDGDLVIIYDEGGPLSNGDKLTVSLLDFDLEAIQQALHPLGYTIETLHYELTVSGL